jgi:hypothetical protein
MVMSDKLTTIQSDRLTLAQLLAESARKHHAAESKQSKCPSCGAVLPESFRTDDVTSETGQKDPDNVGDRPEVTPLKAKYANRHLSVVDRILVNRGIDPFEDQQTLRTSAWCPQMRRNRHF